MGGAEKHPTSNCTFFLRCLCCDRLAVEGAGVGRGGVGTRRTDIGAIGA